MMVEWLRGRASDRKLRLFACAFWGWQEAEGGMDPEMIRALAYAERWAERGSIPARSSEPLLPLWLKWHPLFARKASDAANWTIRKTAAGYRTTDTTRAAKQQVLFLRDIFGNPFRPVTIPPAVLLWEDGTVANLPAAIYEGRHFDRLPILADALEEAGCDNAEILAHLRSGGVHAKGCWALDAILGKR
jgi:hypothetical protein